MTNMTSKLLYSKEHEWVEMIGKDLVRIGITDFAQQELGDIVYVENPEEGEDITAEESMGSVESVKAVSEIFSPVTGTVVKINEELDDEPELINTNPYDQGWFVEVKITDFEQLDSLMDEDAYNSLINEGDA
ncbi:glycine cleavage system H protein [Scopulibacillus darangshiensis]|uniref:Glycine cleavage system H protein n=1 Tax=Scopulibacillus darangshiensis TaxID=442528 RepID=A0A4R2P4S8_9BACL|nr:glycine cleavage system protein GcvH [Scopulibacillus darangshiensis]TCP29829.1 glycine cleavage system H protein [Scopulibacillus darangshiensis]